ncbi:MAG: AzlC family ABC transporter permease [Treponema sp.]|nr:AzlC family ABC transporter permease [Treponema sp.]
MNRYLFKQAFKITIPIFFGYIAIGIPFGINIVAAGYPWWIAPLMSVTIYAGAGQYVAVGLFAAGLSIPQIMITELFVNIRHIVYGLSLITKFKKAGKWKPYLIFALTDETYAILTGVDLPKDAEAGPFYGCIALLNHIYWILGGVIGAVACTVLQYFHMEQYLQGVDFALTAMFVVILIEQIRKSKDIFPPVVGGLTCVAGVVLWKLGIVPTNNIILVAIALGLAAIVLVRGRQFFSKTAKNISAKNISAKNLSEENDAQS